MAVTTRHQEKHQAKRGANEDSVKQQEPPQKEQKTKHENTTKKTEDSSTEKVSFTPKTKNSNAIAKNKRNQPLLDKLDELANAMFSAQNANSKNRFKGIAIKRAVNALAKVDFEIQSGDSVFKGDNKIPGVGGGTAGYIDEYIESGEIKEINDYAKLAEQAKENKNEEKKEEGPEPEKDEHTDEDDLVKINRAPVLTLWVTVVAQREGFSREEAVTYGKWVATVFAQSKGRALGKFDTSKGPPAEEHVVEKHGEVVEKEPDHIMAFGDKKIPVSKDSNGNRLAVIKEEPVEPAKVEDYLKRKFGDKLNETEAAMKELADNMELEELKEDAYDLYTQIRPEWKGWGKKAALNLSEIRQLAHQEDN